MVLHNYNLVLFNFELALISEITVITVHVTVHVVGVTQRSLDFEQVCIHDAACRVKTTAHFRRCVCTGRLHQILLRFICIQLVLVASSTAPTAHKDLGSYTMHMQTARERCKCCKACAERKQKRMRNSNAMNAYASFKRFKPGPRAGQGTSV